MSANNGSDANEFIYLFVCTLCSKTFFSSTQKPKFSNSSLIRNIWSILIFQGVCPTGMGRTEPWEQSWNMVEEPLFGGDKIKITNPLSIQRNLRLCITQEI